MKKVYRHENNAFYWDRRWSESGEDSERFDDLSIYPIRYAEIMMTDRSKKTLEIGCGLGRVLLHYYRDGFSIAGMERSQVAVDKIKECHSDVDVRQGDALDLPYGDGAFDIVMAFGVYHNLEQRIDQGLAEVSRCLSQHGKFCISMRPNNVEMHLNEVYWNWHNRSKKMGEKQFHKVLVGEREFTEMLSESGLIVDEVHRARNVSLLYRLPFLRSRESVEGSEAVRRSKGYRLNAAGRYIDRVLRALFPYHTANVLVFVGHKD
ncbi:class I SAM-dependent methyltransferase [Magnetovibrio blakemorei]|uniref:Methyltransferase type 11 domain-containing protein n=1 Tax=Magnetovibrio blakemorei TaxID=28181 RepID=A0A1E5QBW2_9PROT|nr:class I SAM-dependent methyltransferase [Magnetovibrio blakemorei]OEJ69563.1 hypothetical protein BEN30_02480 [Magnetovibrio blakemorei]